MSDNTSFVLVFAIFVFGMTLCGISHQWSLASKATFECVGTAQ